MTKQLTAAQVIRMQRDAKWAMKCMAAAEDDFDRATTKADKRMAEVQFQTAQDEYQQLAGDLAELANGAVAA